MQRFFFLLCQLVHPKPHTSCLLPKTVRNIITSQSICVRSPLVQCVALALEFITNGGLKNNETHFALTRDRNDETLMLILTSTSDVVFSVNI